MASSAGLNVDPSKASYDTALCLLPPRELWGAIDGVRSLHDKAWPRWPPHINLIYPFVKHELLPTVLKAISRTDLLHSDILDVDLHEVEAFIHKKKNTIYACPMKGTETEKIVGLANKLRQAVRMSSMDSFQPHMTFAQSHDTHSTIHHRLVDTVRQALPIRWSTSELSILVREADGAMKLWGSFDLSTRRIEQHSVPQDPYAKQSISQSSDLTLLTSPIQSGYQFCQTTLTWSPVSFPADLALGLVHAKGVIIASMNILDYVGPPFDPASKTTLLDDLLGDRASADILVLQGVTNCVLSFILGNDDIRDRYPYCTHAPHQLVDSDAFANPYGVVALSKWPMQWRGLDLGLQQNSGCLLVSFPRILFNASPKGVEMIPLAVAACQLPYGVTDEVITSKSRAMQSMVAVLETSYSHHAWIAAGDFGLTSSTWSIEQAFGNGKMSDQGRHSLLYFDSMLVTLGFQDAWVTTKLEVGESSDLSTISDSTCRLDPGEQGATSVFPATTLEFGHASEDDTQWARPQRNAKILVGKQSQLHPKGFNLFGQATKGSCPSLSQRHKGLRALLLPKAKPHDDVQLPEVEITGQLQQVPYGLDSFRDLPSYLATRAMIATPSERAAHATSLNVLERILVGSAGPRESSSVQGVKLVLATVGSFGLGVWSKTSTVVCLCIGNITSMTFFAITSKRLLKRQKGGEITHLRRGRGSAGSKFQFLLHGTKFDLYYCAAAAIVETWPEVMKRPSSDPVFSLAFETTAQLKPLRDVYYLRKSIPDMAQYRMAHVTIRLWAQNRGLFDSSIGLIGDTHITALLVPVCKLLAFGGRSNSTAELVTAFFFYYSDLDWQTQIVYDPFYHKDLDYRRGFREPMCLLGWHSPTLNTANNLTAGVVSTLAAEFKLAKSLLSGNSLTWPQFFGTDVDSPGSLGECAATQFLESYSMYIKVEARYWGSSATKLGRFTHRLKSQCAKMVLEIDKRLPGLRPRVWPRPFVEKLTNMESQGINEEYHACHLVGLALSGSPQDTDSEVVLLAVLRDLDKRILLYSGSRICWVKSSVIQARELESLRLKQEQVEVNGDTDEIDSEDCDSLTDEEDEEEEGEGGEWWDNNKMSQQGNATNPGESLNAPKTASHGSSTTDGTAKTERKLRSAADVINRLRWDLSMDTSNYVVGYIDRFKGTQEKTLEQWKSEQTDEDFIPQHRILYFRRVGDGAVLWDRKLRIDEIFGSGPAGHGEANSG